MQIPNFPECQHSLVKSLQHQSDRELLTLFQQHPGAGRYFIAIFCRYSPLVYTLIRHSARSPVQADYLFAVTWRHIYYEMRGLELQESAADQTLQSWLISVTAVCINRAELPPVEEIHYSLAQASPPLWCFVEQALDRLLPVQRLMVLMSQTFRWNETRIAAYLQAEGEAITAAQVKQQLQASQQQLEALLPADVAEIYLDRSSSAVSEPTEPTDLDEEIDWSLPPELFSPPEIQESRS